MESPVADEEVLIARRRAYRNSHTRPRQALGLTRGLRNQLMAACPDSLIGKRDKAIIALGYDTLCRRSELVAVRFEDIILGLQPRGPNPYSPLKNRPLRAGTLRIYFAENAQILRDWQEAAKIERALSSAVSRIKKWERLRSIRIGEPHYKVCSSKCGPSR